MLHPAGLCLCCGLVRSASFTMHKTHSLRECASPSHSFHMTIMPAAQQKPMLDPPGMCLSCGLARAASFTIHKTRSVRECASPPHSFHMPIMPAVSHELLWVRSRQQLHSSAVYAMWRGTGNISNLNSNCWGEEHLKSKHQLSGNPIIYIKCNVGLDTKVENDSQKNKSSSIKQ